MTRRPSEREVFTAANTLVKAHGDDAALEAGQQADQAIEAGDPDRLAFWKRVVEAVEVLRTEEVPPGTTMQ